MLIAILHTAECPNVTPLIARAQQLAARHRDIDAVAILVADGEAVPHGFAGSPTVLVDGINPFGGLPSEAPTCALRPPGPDELESAAMEAR